MTTPVFPDKDQIALIEGSFPALLAIRPSISELFYQRLAVDSPEVFSLFKDAEPAGQQQKLLAAITLLVTNLHQQALLESYFQALGERHQQYGVKAEMFQPFTDCWMMVINDNLPEANGEAISVAWRQLMNYVTALMQDVSTENTPVNMPVSAGNGTNIQAYIADLLSQQQRLITQLSLTASREPAAQHLLNDLAELRLLSSALQSALNNQSSF